MISLSRKNAKSSEYQNIEFRLGEIEHLPVADNSVDVVISNCVINLSLDKKQVFKEIYRVLKTSGRLSISDVVATAALPKKFKNDLKMISDCIGGAEEIYKIKELLFPAGFHDIKTTLKNNPKEIIKTWLPDSKIEDYIASAILTLL